MEKTHLKRRNNFEDLLMIIANFSYAGRLYYSGLAIIIKNASYAISFPARESSGNANAVKGQVDRFFYYNFLHRPGQLLIFLVESLLNRGARDN